MLQLLELGLDCSSTVHRLLVSLRWACRVPAVFMAVRLMQMCRLSFVTPCCCLPCRQGSVHLPVWRRLTQQAVAGRLTVLEGWEVASAGQLDGSQGSWRLTLKPYSHEHTREQAAAPSLFQQAVAATAAVGQRTGASQGAPNPQAGATPKPDAAPLVDAAPAAPQTPPPAQQPQQQQQEEVSLESQLVWLCCGSAYDAAADPVLRGLQLAAPTLLAGGYACLDDEHLCWPGAGVYIAGRGALLSVGPTAGDLPGMRLAADRIASSLRRLGYADGPVWDAAQQSLLRRLCLSDATSSGSSSSAAAAGATDADVVSRLAAAVVAASAALGPLPLEAEGLPFEDPKPKVGWLCCCWCYSTRCQPAVAAGHAGGVGIQICPQARKGSDRKSGGTSRRPHDLASEFVQRNTPSSSPLAPWPAGVCV
jgi:hypothetical protein